MNKMIRRTDPTEHQIVSGVMDFARITLVEIPPGLFDHNCLSLLETQRIPLIYFFVKITNEGKRSFGHMKYLKKEGFNKGVSDSFLAYPVMKEGRIGLWMEAKSKKGKVSRDQERWSGLMKLMGYDSVIYRSVDEGIKTIKDYLGI